MQVTNVNNNIIQIKSDGKSSPFKSGTQIKATVSQVNSDGTVILESDKGVFTASNTSNYGLNPGDTVSLIVTEPSYDGSAATTAITQINGQPIDQNVSLSELHLIDLGIMPNSTNLRLYNILNKYQLPLTKEFILNLKEVFNNLPGITDEQAAFLAANNIEPTIENLNALTNVGSLHENISSLINEATQQIMTDYNISSKTLEQILAALNNITQPQAEPEGILNNAAEEASETILQPQITETSNEAAAINNQAGKGEIQPALSQTADAAVFIPDKSEAVLEITNYVTDALNVSTPENGAAASENIQNAIVSDSNIENEAVAILAPKLAEAVVSSVVDQITASPNVTIKTIDQLKLPENMPAELKQTIAALPDNAQQEITQILPKMLQSAKEFLSVKLVNFAERQINVHVDKEISGLTLKNNVKNIGSNINSILPDKPGAASQQTVTSLKLSDSTMSFVQIPVVINDFKSSAEIYIVKRDSSKKLSLKNGIKVVFALNTEYIGRVESIISANTKDLSLNIRVENSKVQEVVQRELSFLKSLLSSTGFNLSLLKITTIDKPVSVLNAHTLFGYKQLDITV